MKMLSGWSLSSIVIGGEGEAELASMALRGEDEEEILLALVEGEAEAMGASGEGEGGLGDVDAVVIGCGLRVVDGCGAAGGDGREDRGLAATEADVVGVDRADGVASY